MGQARMKKSRSFPVNRSAVSPQDLPLVVLPKPGRDGGGTVMRALWKRRTVRELSERDLSLQMLSNLLWAACGVNRKKGPFGISGRTAASASNSQEIDLYAALQDGIYLYDPFEHTLAPVAAGDLRRLANNPGQAALSASRATPAPQPRDRIASYASSSSLSANSGSHWRWMTVPSKVDAVPSRDAPRRSVCTRVATSSSPPASATAAHVLQPTTGE